MKWKKCGQIKDLVKGISWSEAYAQVPTLLLKEDRLRVFFATRPRQDMTLTSYCDLDLNDLTKVLYIHDKPILPLGEPGTFDQHGIMPSAIVNKDGLIYLYYSGWCRSVGVPYNNYTGLAISEDGGNTFLKAFQGPVLDRTKYELFSATSPDVYFDGATWHCWYCSGTNWHKINDKFEHTYDIKYASSMDGMNWDQSNMVSIAQHNSYEAITKPTVIELNGIYHMWYCYRGSFGFRGGNEGYKIGYATSEDKINWKRTDELSGIGTSESGWDNEMVGYPAVVKIGKDVYMFYNGNNFGRDGFGFAKLEF
jgi:predicted GH43/DUF377 family glycosyl hydrolase